MTTPEKMSAGASLPLGYPQCDVNLPGGIRALECPYVHIPLPTDPSERGASPVEEPALSATRVWLDIFGESAKGHVSWEFACSFAEDFARRAARAESASPTQAERYLRMLVDRVRFAGDEDEETFRMMFQPLLNQAEAVIPATLPTVLTGKYDEPKVAPPDAGRWISVEERLPATSDSVIVHYNYAACGEDWYSGPIDIANTLFVEAHTNLITHWMPLPDPPAARPDTPKGEPK